jgi:putative transposase
MRNPFKYFNSSPEIVPLTVLMYVKYPLSLRNVEDLFAERSIDIRHETVRHWWNRFGPIFAAEIKKKRLGRPVPFRIGGGISTRCSSKSTASSIICGARSATKAKCSKWSPPSAAIEKAALILLKRLMKKYGKPHSIVTDRLRSYDAAMNVIANSDRRECGRWINNRAENSHQPFRRRERAMLRFRSMKTL